MWTGLIVGVMSWSLSQVGVGPTVGSTSPMMPPSSTTMGPAGGSGGGLDYEPHVDAMSSWSNGGIGGGQGGMIWGTGWEGDMGSWAGSGYGQPATRFQGGVHATGQAGWGGAPLGVAHDGIAPATCDQGHGSCGGGGCGGGMCGFTLMRGVTYQLGCINLGSLGLSTGDMPQHLPYWNPSHGYYYFRPYNAVWVPAQVEVATRMGEDPRAPYSNRIFQAAYEQIEAQIKAKEEMDNLLNPKIPKPIVEPPTVVPPSEVGSTIRPVEVPSTTTAPAPAPLPSTVPSPSPAPAPVPAPPVPAPFAPAPGS